MKNLMRESIYKQKCLENEKEWGYRGLYFVSGIEVHEENFVELVIDKIN